jgi:hypothetical protein
MLKVFLINVLKLKHVLEPGRLAASCRRSKWYKIMAPTA